MRKAGQDTLPFPEGRFDDGVFNVGREKGFLPKYDPPSKLPPVFKPLQEVLDKMPVYTESNSEKKGLLAVPNAIVEAVSQLPNLTSFVESLNPAVEADARELHIVFRAYAFLSSAFLLEKSYHSQTTDGNYGKARTVLPSQLAIPFVKVAQKLEQQPFLEYHYAYSLGNYVKIDESKGFHWSNLKMACCFSGMKDEQGFIMLHVTINSHSGHLIGGISDALAGAKSGDYRTLCSGIRNATAAMKKINSVRRQMWTASRPEHYNDFRVFIMGVAGNKSIFGDGVIYQGVDELQNKPQKPRGQTGAQDDIIPTCDIFSGVTKFYPKNKLTEYLYDLRQYRPKVVQNFFAGLQEEVRQSGFHDVLIQSPEAIMCMLEFVQEIFVFRNGHWQFVQRYILQQTKHETATGGTPITSWLPNQLEAVLNQLDEFLRLIPNEVELPKSVIDIKAAQPIRREVLSRQMEELTKLEYDVDVVYKFNPKGHIDEVKGLAEAMEAEQKCPFH